MFPLVQSGRRAASLPLTCATAEYPAVFDARLEAGRWFSEDDDLAARPVAVISDRVWRQWFNANPAIVNQATVRALHTTFTIIGVAPPGLTGADLWIPFGASKLLAPPALTPEQQATWDAMTKYVVISVRRQAGALEARLTRFVDDAVTSGGGFGEPTLTARLVPYYVAPGIPQSRRETCLDAVVRLADSHWRVREPRQHVLRTRPRARDGDRRPPLARRRSRSASPVCSSRRRRSSPRQRRSSARVWRLSRFGCSKRPCRCS